jgi:multiple sugar transport system substrate-binding protein
MVARHCSEQADINVERVACEHDDFKRNWREYLKHYPNSVFAWLGGEMVKRAMNDKLIEPFPQNRKVVKGLFPTARAHDLSHAVPFRFYPWAIYYNVNLLEEIPRPEDKSTNYAKNPPEDWADFLALANLLKAKGKRPIALGNLQGWPALGVFDILNLRINGYEFHENLLMGSGKSAVANYERWNDTRIRRVFKEWARLVPYFRTAQEDDESIRSVTRWTNRQSCASYYGTNSASGNDRLWWNTKTDKEAAEALMAGDAAMVLTGGFVAKYLQKADGKFGVFKFPATRPEASPFPRPDDTTAIDIAVDSFVLSKRKPTDGQCRECPDELLLCLQKTETFGVFNKQDSDMTPGGFLSVNDGSKEAVKYTALQMQEYEIVKNATHLANFLDRETTGTFAEDVVIPSLRCFLDYTSGFGNATDFDNDTDFDNFVTSVVSEIEDRAQKWKQNR